MAIDQERLEKTEQRGRILIWWIAILVVLLSVAVVLCIILCIDNANLAAQNTQQTTTVTNTNQAIVETAHDINLDEKDTDITLTEDGEYNLTGTTTHQINITSAEDVQLNLNGVNIATETDTAINYTGEKTLSVNLVANTQNILISNGTGVDGGTIHSSGNLDIWGNGLLETYGAGRFGNGITTKRSYAIHGGNVLILGSDMIEKPVGSQQSSLDFDLSRAVQSGSSIQIRNQRGTILRSFVADQDFRTLIFSQPGLGTGNYSLFVDNKNIDTVNL